MTTSTVGPPLQRHVSAVVTQVERDYLSDQQGPAARGAAALAQLRRAINTAPGADPFVWELMFADWPPELAAHSDEPTIAERAAHAALTLYAVHQQGRRQSRMHRTGRSLGLAVGELGRSSGAEDAVRRRFDALATADDLSEILYHGRGLITQLRSADIGLDYGLLASHLALLQREGFADRVRLRWGRDYYRRTTDSSAPSTTTATTSEGAPA